MLKYLLSLLVLCSLSVVSKAEAASSYDVTEPKKIKSSKKLKTDQGAVRLSVRLQIQTTQTLFVYFVRLNDDGSDSKQLLRFERGAGAPFLGSNMIDPKPVVYRAPPGKYRPMAFTVACEGLPTVGAVCSGAIAGSGGFPTGRYLQSSPIVEIRPGHITEAGDFVVEYTGAMIPGKHVGEIKKNGLDYALRWKPLAPLSSQKFSSLPVLRTKDVEPEFQSKITCSKRPKGVSLYIPFAC